MAGSTSNNDGYTDSSLKLENRRFTYKELETITKNFRQVLGQGGFGCVYHGFLENGIQVAVKLRSHSSDQGVKEFLIEVKFDACFYTELWKSCEWAWTHLHPYNVSNFSLFLFLANYTTYGFETLHVAKIRNRMGKKQLNCFCPIYFLSQF